MALVSATRKCNVTEDREDDVRLVPPDWAFVQAAVPQSGQMTDAHRGSYFLGTRITSEQSISF